LPPVHPADQQSVRYIRLKVSVIMPNATLLIEMRSLTLQPSWIIPGNFMDDVVFRSR
jgi:hypothetical protein